MSPASFRKVWLYGPNDLHCKSFDLVSFKKTHWHHCSLEMVQTATIVYLFVCLFLNTVYSQICLT